MPLWKAFHNGKSHLAVSILKNFPAQEREYEEAQKSKNEYKHYIENHKDEKEDETIIENIKYCREMIENYLWKIRRARCFFMPFVDFVTHNQDAVYNIDKIKGYDSVLIDDFYLQARDSIIDQIYFIVDYRHRTNRQTLLTSRFSIEEINHKFPNLAARLDNNSKIFLLKERYEKEPELFR